MSANLVGSGQEGPLVRPPLLLHSDGEEKEPSAEWEPATDRAFGRALSNSRSRLTSFARWLVRDRDAAEDLVQETMLRAWASRKQFEPGSNLKAWTFRILRNLFVSQRRRARFVGEFDEGDAERKLAQGETQSGTAQLTELAGWMEQLPAAQQHALRMIAVESLSYEEAAGRAGVSVGTMKSRVYRAREALRAMANGRPQAVPVCLTVDEARGSRTRATSNSSEGDPRRAWLKRKPLVGPS